MSVIRKSTKAAKKALEIGAELSDTDAVEYFSQIVVAGLAILRVAKGDKFVDDFLNAALKDKSIITFDHKMDTYLTLNHKG